MTLHNAQVRVCYYHPPIRSKGWQTRRMNILAEKVSRVFSFSFPTRNIGASAWFNSVYGAAMTVGLVTFTRDVSHDEINLFLSNFCWEDFDAELLTAEESSDTIHPCTDPKNQPQPT